MKLALNTIIPALIISSPLTTLDKMDSMWLEAFIRNLLKSGLTLSPKADDSYELRVRDSFSEGPYLTFDMRKYRVRVAKEPHPCLAVFNLIPQLKYRNRSVIRTFFQSLTSTLDETNTPCILCEDITTVSTKYTEDYLQTLGFHSQSLMKLVGVDSTLKWVRTPKGV